MSLTVRSLVLERSDGVRLLGPVDLDLAPGERLAVLGESGSGKTLLARALAGALPPGVRRAAGEIRQPRHPGPGPALAWVPQDPWTALHPLLSVRQHLALLPAALHREAPAAALSRLAPLLAHLCLPAAGPFLDRRPHQLSGGQRQRLCLAMALAAEPEVLIFDEPTSSLDPEAAARFRDLAGSLPGRRPATTFWITHDLAAARACDRALVLYGGWAVEAGPARQVLGSPRHPYTARLLAAARGEASREAGFLPAPEDRPAGCPFRPRCPRSGPACQARVPWHGSLRDGWRCAARPPVRMRVLEAPAGP